MNAQTQKSSFTGPAGTLEMARDEPAGASRGVAVIAHPHPLFGGTLDNKVVQTLARAFTQAGCMNRCAAGPVAVVYPEAVWYTYVDEHDIDEIVESHLKNGIIVERLRTPTNLGR